MGNITGTVVKLTNKYVVLIMPDGSFKNIKRSRGYIPLIGEQLIIDSARIPAAKYRWVAAVAVVCLIMAVILKWGSFSPDKANTAYIVALDINPSIEIQTDEHIRILSIAALNDDGKKIVDDTTYSDMDLFQALDSIVGKCISNGYLKQEKNGFVKITIVPMKGKHFEYEKRLNDSLHSLFQSKNIKATLEIGSASREILEKAHQTNLSVNRYILYQSLVKKGSGITVEEAKNMPLQQLSDYDSIENKHEERVVPVEDNSTEGSGKDDFGTMTNNTVIRDGINEVVSPESSINSEATEFKGNNDQIDINKQGTLQNDTTNNITGVISETVPGDNIDNGSRNTETEDKPGGTGEESSGSTEGKTPISESTAGSGNTESTKPTENNLQPGESIYPGQESESTSNSSINNGSITNDSSTDSGASNSMPNSGANNK